MQNSQRCLVCLTKFRYLGCFKNIFEVYLIINKVKKDWSRSSSRTLSISHGWDSVERGSAHQNASLPTQNITDINNLKGI
jgi:hypothetical protein